MRIKLYILLLFMIIPSLVIATSIDTFIEVDFYGNAKIQHIINQDYENLSIKLYYPESLDINKNIKYSIEDNTLTLINPSKGTTINYISNGLIKKDKEWFINYDSIQKQHIKVILPFSTSILSSTSNNLISKERIGKVIEWDYINEFYLRYDLNDYSKFDFKNLFYITLFLFFIVLFFFIKEIMKKPKPIQSNLFIQRIKGIKRPIIKRVIFAILKLYDKGDKLIDQAKIRHILKKEGFEKINNHKSEINSVVKNEIHWLIKLNESKIEINDKAEKEYNLSKNVKTIIKIIKREDLIEKGDGYGK